MAWRAERLLAHPPTYRSSKRKRVEDALSLRQIGVPVPRLQRLQEHLQDRAAQRSADGPVHRTQKP